MSNADTQIAPEAEQAPAEFTLDPPVILRCCCCGSIFKGRQWHNRDAGYGLCNGCVDFCRARNTEQTMLRCYGVYGVHYGVKMGGRP